MEHYIGKKKQWFSCSRDMGVLKFRDFTCWSQYILWRIVVSDCNWARPLFKRTEWKFIIPVNGLFLVTFFKDQTGRSYQVSLVYFVTLFEM